VTCFESDMEALRLFWNLFSGSSHVTLAGGSWNDH